MSNILRDGCARLAEMLRLCGLVEVREVPGYDGYFVSSDGRVYSERVSGRGSSCKRGSRKLLKGWTDKDGYPHVVLQASDKRRTVAVHRLVAAAFIGPRPFESAIVRHLDDVPTNNNWRNLAYGTYLDNAIDAAANGRIRVKGAADDWLRCAVKQRDARKRHIRYNAYVV
jgi:hypothetical protein